MLFVKTFQCDIVLFLFGVVLVCMIALVLYLFAQNHIDILHVNNEIKTVSGMCQEHTGCHNEN